jgi:hypothetical protein
MVLVLVLLLVMDELKGCCRQWIWNWEPQNVWKLKRSIRLRELGIKSPRNPVMESAGLILLSRLKRV